MCTIMGSVPGAAFEVPDAKEYAAGQRVRVGEEDDPATHVGKMAK